MVLIRCTPEENAASLASNSDMAHRFLQPTTETFEIRAGVRTIPIQAGVRLDPYHPFFDMEDLENALPTETPSQQEHQDPPRSSSPPPPPPPPPQALVVPQAQEEDETSDQYKEASTTMKKLELPLQNGIRVVKKLMEQVVVERSFSRPPPNSSNEYKIECVGAIGRDNRNRVRLCVKWEGYPWSESTWSLLKDVSETVKAGLIGVWGPLGNIRADTRALSGVGTTNDDEEEVEEPPRKKAKIT